MGKIVKHCAACDENFAEKFGYCPNCGAGLQAFEMNPLAGKTTVNEEAQTSASNVVDFGAKTSSPNGFEKSSKIEPVIVSETTAFSANEKTALTEETSVNDFADLKAETAAVKSDVFATAETAATSGNGNGSRYQHQTSNYDFQATGNGSHIKSDDGYNITVIEEKNVKQRNILLLGSMAFMVTLVLGATIYSLFNKDLMVGAIEEGNALYVAAIDEEPMDVEEEEKPKNDKDAGGGGGGGRDKPEPTSKGQLATQTEKPMIAPTVTLVKKDFELQYQASTQGKKVIKQTDEPYGDPNSKYTLSSDGTGTGGGQGSGTGTGQGSGRGTGAGSGIGSGFGGGQGDGDGNGRGSGREGRSSNAPPPPPVKKPEPVGPSTGVSIISKPRPGYTDAARQNQVTGTVRLRVTFSASGQIAGISPISGLPYGLTEQAIAAARGIKFEPAKKNGVPYTVTKQVEYTFTMY